MVAAERHERISKLFATACQVDASERRALLERECAGDETLLAAVEKLLMEDAAAGVFLDRPLLALPQVSLIGQRIGGYELVRVIASGGMGTVYEALQESPRRAVALKVMRHGLASPSAQRRFQYESQLLGRLRHAAIAQVYEAGTHASDAGFVPFFALEYVPDARTLTEYARSRKLTTRARLELFRQVCAAVHHGHQQGIIHRDLKPGNILVDANGQVKVIDFGVARATDSDVAVTTLRTEAGQLLGTLQYMSPEQCGADPHAVDTRSDVYSLGVVLYELLCERLPYDVQGVALHNAVRLIREEAPTRPSAVLRALRGDVETITLKALSKERERRYASAAELEQDIRRYLDDEPIWARPPSTTYQLRMFARRHVALVTGAVAVLLALVLGVIGTTRGMIRAERAARVSDQRTQSLRAVNELFQQVLLEAHPNRAQGRDVTVTEALEAVEKWVDREGSKDPIIEAWVRFTLADIQTGRGRHDLALSHAEGAMSLWREQLGEGHADTLDAAKLVGGIYDELGRLQDAEVLHRRTLELRRELLGAGAEPVLGSMSDLGNVLRALGRPAEAEPLLREALAGYAELSGRDSEEVLAPMNNLALTLEELGDREEAGRLFDDLLATQERVLAPDHPRRIEGLVNGGWFLIRDGDDARAVDLFADALERTVYVLPDDLRLQHMIVEGLVMSLRNLERYEDAIAVLEQQLSFDRQALGEDDAFTMQTTNVLGIVLQDAGRVADAGPLLARVYEWTRKQDECGVFTAVAAHCLAYQRALEGNAEEAERLYRESLTIDETVAAGPEQVALTELCLGILLARAGRVDEALSFLKSAEHYYAGTYGADHYQAARARKWIDNLSTPCEPTPELGQ